MNRRDVLQGLAGSLLAAPGLLWAADAYPSKPITWIVGYGAGGNADLRSRQMARGMAEVLGVNFIVENKPGAGANIGTAFIVKAE